MSSYGFIRELARLPRTQMDCVTKHRNRNSIYAALDGSSLDAIREEIGATGNTLRPAFTKLMDEIGVHGRRQVGCFMGMVIGDALGGPVEFTPVQDNSFAIRISLSSPDTAHNSLPEEFGTVISDPEGRVIYPEGIYNPFSLLPGQWTDDASMGACLADSLIICDDGSLADTAPVTASSINNTWVPSFSGRDIRSRFWNWAANGYNNAFKNCKIHSPYKSVGLGGNISKSLAEISNTRYREIPDFFISAADDSGNGGLMRLAPIPVFYSKASLELCMKYCGLSSQTTHPGVLATRAAEFMGYFIYHAINRPADDMRTASEFAFMVSDLYLAEYCIKGTPSFKDGNDTIARLLVANEPMSSTEYNWNWREKQLGLDLCMHNRGDSYNGYPNSAGYFGSYCLDGLTIALNAFAQTNSFTECLEKCVNYRGDCDSTGSIAAQIAGSFYGITSVPYFLINVTLPWDDSENLIRAIMLTTWYRQKSANYRKAYIRQNDASIQIGTTDCSDKEAAADGDFQSSLDRSDGQITTHDFSYTKAYAVYPPREQKAKKSFFCRILRLFSR